MPSILLVDDEVSVRRALRKFLERGGMTVIEAGSAPEALKLIDRDDSIDAVVSDVLMPGMSGLAFYDELITHSPRLSGRVVFLTGAAGDPAIYAPVEQRGVPLVSKVDDLMLVVDAVRLATLPRKTQE